ncbi:hypothetical protein HanXRQr2_Chr08g0321911 [Helianthus annuus]|uniref:Uncharacterized protein n=1 Tax=Helianthus annuus TaxID=4232 RepID=A0A9K3NBY3_HELAN|nr:hypothetical protein HanXRQr2_Chr08g0321911 [Helianthus annuus]KAJ0900263.1 hypothetical protein HanPSC8_Chr08g0311901 [Helianthus annuus]
MLCAVSSVGFHGDSKCWLGFEDRIVRRKANIACKDVYGRTATFPVCQRVTRSRTVSVL